LADSGKYSDIQNDPALSSFGEGVSEPVDLPRFSVSQLTTLRTSFDDDLLFRQQAGMTAIGLWRKKIEEFGEQKAIEAVRKSGLNVTTLSYAGGFTGSAGLQFREALDDGYQAVFTAAAVGARTLVVSPGARGRYTARHEQRLVTQAVRELSIVAEELGVQLALMPRNSRLAGRWTSLHSLEEAIALCDATGRSNVGVAYDTFYLAGVDGVLQPDDELRIAEQCASRIFVLQLRDAPEIAGAEYAQYIPGTGVLPLADTVQCLFEHGFHGDIDIQVFSEEIWRQDPCSVLSSCGRSVHGLLKNCLVDAASSIGA
jgi:sugar phosphate isomerase/epimerase